MKQKLFLVYFNVSLVCVILVGMELVGQIVHVLVKGYPVYESDRHLTSEHEQLFELHPFLAARLRSNVSVREGEKVVTTTSNHTRWTGASADDISAIKIATVGGSTTFGAGVSDTESWPARLQAILGKRYSVTNFGMPGYSTAEAITQMALLVPESRPDIVVVYEGWNDLHNFHDPYLGSDYYSHGLRQYSNLAIERPQPKGLFAKLVQVSAVCRLAMIVAKKVAVATGAQPSGSEELVTAPGSNPDPFVERIYRRNLTTLRLLAQQSGAYVLFIPQLLDGSRFKGNASSWWTPRIRNDAMPYLLQRMNLIMAETCSRTDAECAVLDALAARKWQPDDFIDEGHFSKKGNDAFAKLVASRIVEDGDRHLMRVNTVQRVAWETDPQHLLHSHPVR